VFPGINLVGAFLISYVRARADSLGGKLPRLWMRRSDRVIILAIALLLGEIQLPGVHFRAPLTMLIVAVSGVLNIWAFIAALLAARTCLAPESRHVS
jgi:CDP-diacylglycerol--glycerol-3-phosphate 3-phosphatidyltransferase